MAQEVLGGLEAPKQLMLHMAWVVASMVMTR
jgi:hypothetical protein